MIGFLACQYGECSKKLLAEKSFALSVEKKLAKVICPDKWKDGARNTTEGGGRKLNENKLLGKGKNSRFSPYTVSKCKICKQNVHQQGGMYCQACAYSKGLCALCGKIIMDTKDYKQSQA